MNGEILLRVWLWGVKFKNELEGEKNSWEGKAMNGEMLSCVGFWVVRLNNDFKS